MFLFKNRLLFLLKPILQLRESIARKNNKTANRPSHAIRQGTAGIMGQVL
jgi:hypothetical protein